MTIVLLYTLLMYLRFYARQQNASRGLAIVEVSVRLSVCYTVVLCQTDTS